MQQLMMFDLGPAPELPPRPVYRRVRGANDGPTPQQKELNLRKLLRKIAFRRRTKEAKGIGNNEAWSTEAIVKVHKVLFNDWENRFPICTNPRDQFDLWMWMLGDANEAFSFRDCLVIEGYLQPDEFIESCAKLTPKWVRDILDMEPDQQVEAIKSLVATHEEVVPARKLLDQNVTIAA